MGNVEAKLPNCENDYRNMCRWVQLALEKTLEKGEASNANPTYQELMDSHDEKTSIIEYFYQNASESCLRRIEMDLFLKAKNCCLRHANINLLPGYN